MSEIIREGSSGFVVTDVKAASEAVWRLCQLDREAVRADAVQRFDSNRIVDGYIPRVWARNGGVHERVADVVNH